MKIMRSVLETVSWKDVYFLSGSSNFKVTKNNKKHQNKKSKPYQSYFYSQDI